MKTKIMIVIAVVAIFFAPAIVAAQAVVKNTTAKVVTLKSADGSAEVTVQPHSKARVSFAPFSGAFTFDLYYYEGVGEKKAGRINKTVVSKSEVEITTGDLYGIKQVGQAKTEGSAKTTNPVLINLEKKEVPTATVYLLNSSDFTVVCLDGPFEGIALKPGQKSKKAYSVPTGQIELTFKHDVEKDSTAHGRKYRQSVYSGIITQDQEDLDIANENLTEMGGITLKTYAKSAIPFKLVFTAGPWKGQALRFGDFTKKAELNEGFNSLAIQFVGNDGLKYQADIEVIVTKRDKPLFFREIDIKNKKAIKQ